jgi:pilus assembly protein CpaF
MPSEDDVLLGVRRALHDELLERVDARGLETISRLERRLRVRDEALAILRRRGHILPQRSLTKVINAVSDEVVGFGPIEFLLKDPEVTEVMVNGADDVYVERRGRIERAPDGLFEGEEAVLHLIERIVGPLGIRVDESSPWADARLPDGSRVHAIIPPLSLRGPCLTVRKFSQVPLSPADLVANGTVGPRMLAFLSACVRGRANLVISGGAGSGKTTLLGVLSSFIPDGERLITIEDAAELRLAKPHVISLESRPPNVEGKGEVTVRELVRNALRMRPDRIIVGEVRGGEALDMLQAMNTGHEGSLSTAHANSPRHLLWRLETMALMSDVELPVAHIRAQISSAIHVIVHMARLRDGRRVVVRIASVEAHPGGEPSVTELFVHRGAGTEAGGFAATGVVPAAARLLQERGEHIPTTVFAEGADR